MKLEKELKKIFFFVAYKWYLLSANQGNEDAQYHIGRFYENGIVVNQDYEISLQWYLKSVSKKTDAQQPINRLNTYFKNRICIFFEN